MTLRGGTAQEIASGIESAVTSGALAPGDLLPAVRALAGELKVSPSTVGAAYGQLRRRGVTIGTGRAGTRISSRPPLQTRLPLPVPKGVRDLRNGWPDPALLPELPAVSGARRLYGEPAVSPRLHKVAEMRFAADGIDPTNLTVVGGALDGLERVLSAWLRVGDTVVTEDPGYSAALDLMAAMGFRVLPVPVDDFGMRPTELRVALRSADALLVSPRAQNPTGAAWDQRRREQLAAIVAERPDLLVVEDDHVGTVAGTETYTLAGVTERWTTIRSVSKWLGPDLRVAVIAGDEATIGRVEGRQALGTGWVSYLLQDTVAQLWSAAKTAKLLERATKTYAGRRDALRESLFDNGFAPTGRSGLTLWVPVHDEPGVTSGLSNAGWAVMPGDRFRIEAAPGIRIALATLQPAEARELAADLRALLRRSSPRLA